jgi:hypothetical protein
LEDYGAPIPGKRRSIEDEDDDEHEDESLLEFLTPAQ